MSSIQKLINQVGVAVVLLTLVVFGRFAYSAPMVLNDGELDSINAGYVNVYGSAHAAATGDLAIADIFVDTDIQTKITENEDGFVYTLATVYAEATAIGEWVETGVFAGFDTDEEIVSLNVDRTFVNEAALVAHLPEPPKQSKNTKSNHKSKNRHKNKKNKHKNKNKHKHKHKHKHKKNKKRNHNKKRNNRKASRNRHRNKGNAKKSRAKLPGNPKTYQRKTIRLTLITRQPAHR